MRRLSLLCLMLALSACGKTQTVVMTDPRTGVSVACQSGHYNLFTPKSVQEEIGTCVDEMRFYGFQEDAALRAAHDAKPPQQRDLPWHRFEPL